MLERLRGRHRLAPQGFWARLLRLGRTPAHGIYLWGGVGRGKTMLLDLFADRAQLAGVRVQRLHFHRFMEDVHSRLRDLQTAAHPDPLRTVAGAYAAHLDVLCLDELFVSDIADAMILGGLFAAFHARDLALVITSNVPPTGLYRDGLQRSRFLPAIELLEQVTDVVQVDAAVDYRLRRLEKAPLVIRADAAADRQLEARFREIAMADGLADGLLSLEGRTLAYRRRRDGVIWFDFDAVCRGPRGTADYIALAREFHTVVVSSVPRLTDDDNAARRFIALVDEFYDRNVKLLLSTTVELEQIYTGERLEFEFRRTLSRLTEMQSRDYLEMPHKP